jgi:hypothetical protein
MSVSKAMLFLFIPTNEQDKDKFDDIDMIPILNIISWPNLSSYIKFSDLEKNNVHFSS